MSGPQPTPQPAPTPTPDLRHITIPNVPPNTYELLSGVADAIDTANGNFNTHATKLGGISSDTNGAVNNVTSTSQGSGANALSDTWKNTQTDFSRAHDPLTGIVASNCMGGSPNPMRDVVDQNKSSIQAGLIAMENIQASQHSINPPSAQQVEGWIQDVNALIGSLGNVNLAMQMMILAIRNLNGGFGASCATGFTPGFPPPTFPNNSFAMSNSGSSGGGSGKISIGDLEDNLKSQGVDPGTAESIALNAEISGLNLDDVQSLIDTGKVTPSELLSWLESGKLTEANLNDVTTLVNKGVSSDAITQLLANGADFKAVEANVTDLLSKGANISDVNQWIQKGLNLKYAKVLLNRGLTVDQINSGIDKYTRAFTNKDPGYQRFNQIPKDIKSGVGDALKRWATGTNTGIGRDGTPFRNDPQLTTKGVKQYPFPGNNSGPYTEYRVGSSSDRIVVDHYGNAYYYSSDNGHYYPDDAIPIPFDYIMQILG